MADTLVLGTSAERREGSNPSSRTMHKWRKSSFSGESNCVEVSWRKSSFSQIDCVEVNWHKSSFSGVNGCVEVADSSDEVLLRNSNHPDLW